MSSKTPPEIVEERVCYALRCRETGKYINAQDYSTFKKQDLPFPVRRLATARSHRLRAMSLDPNLGIVDIERLVITVRVDGQIEEDDAVTSRLLGLCRAVKDGWGFASEIEAVLRENPKARAMRYLLVAKQPPNLAANEISSFVRTVIRGDCFLLYDDADLIAFRMLDGLYIHFIYDFEAGALLP